MKSLPKKRQRPEYTGAKRLRQFMEARGWLVEKVHGSLYQRGFPDFFCHHPLHGSIWIETKVAGGYLRPSQKTKFARWSKYGVKIYVCGDETHYSRLFKPPNWHIYAR